MIKIEWQQKPPRRGAKAGENELYPRLKDNGCVNFEKLCIELDEDSKFSKGTYIAVFSNLMEKVAKYLADGKSVELNDLGTLQVSVGTDAPITTSTKRRSDKVKVKGVNFIPSDDLLKAIGQPQFESKADRATPLAPTAEQLKEPLLAYLSSHGSITRREFEDTFRLKHSTALSRLHELFRMGVISVKGRNRDSVYVLNTES